jgi:hypothetical protein
MYQSLIREILARNGYVGRYDPRHVEAYMRIEHSTLDGLSRAQFAAEVEICRQCVDAGGPDGAERCARSFGL